MRYRYLIFIAFLSVLLAGVRPLSAGETVYGPGTTIETFTVGATTYHNVRIRSVNAHTVFFTRPGGLSSVHLRDLSPEWQARFHYDPAADAAETRPPLAPPPRPAKSAGQAKAETKIDRVLHEFGQPVEVRPKVDLRPTFFALDLDVKDQGRRPSCAIFAIVSALEFQNAELVGQPQKFSEEYLIWATRQTIQRVLPATGGAGAEAEDADAGFSLGEVVDALRTYGIPLQSSMPDTFGRAMDAIEEPSPAVIAEARRNQHVFVHTIPGRNNATRLNNIVHALNAGIPVVVAIGWPSFRTVRAGYLSGQNPMGAHAVTLVGYLASDGQLGHAVFLFKNSWGVAWGQGGYGTATFAYLERCLEDAALLEVQPSGR